MSETIFAADNIDASATKPRIVIVIGSIMMMMMMMMMMIMLAI